MHFLFPVSQARYAIADSDHLITGPFVLHFLIRVYKKEIHRATKNRQTAYRGGEWLNWGGEQQISCAVLQA
jgi:hypothetical protein